MKWGVTKSRRPQTEKEKEDLREATEAEADAAQIARMSALKAADIGLQSGLVVNVPAVFQALKAEFTPEISDTTRARQRRQPPGTTRGERVREAYPPRERDDFP